MSLQVRAEGLHGGAVGDGGGEGQGRARHAARQRLARRRQAACDGGERARHPEQPSDGPSLGQERRRRSGVDTAAGGGGGPRAHAEQAAERGPTMHHTRGGIVHPSSTSHPHRVASSSLTPPPHHTHHPSASRAHGRRLSEQDKRSSEQAVWAVGVSRDRTSAALCRIGASWRGWRYRRHARDRTRRLQPLHERGAPQDRQARHRVPAEPWCVRLLAAGRRAHSRRGLDAPHGERAWTCGAGERRGAAVRLVIAEPCVAAVLRCDASLLRCVVRCVSLRVAMSLQVHLHHQRPQRVWAAQAPAPSLPSPPPATRGPLPSFACLATP